MLKKLSLLFIVFSLFFVFKIDDAHAAALSSVSDTVTNSRPSAASPLTANAASTTSLSVLNNGSRYLASDSAKIVRTSTAADVTTGLVVASQSGGLTTVFFNGSTGSSGQAGTDVLVNNQTAMHTISFATTTTLISGSTIVLTFPGSGTNSASASATGFSFNGLTTANAAANISYRLVSGGAVTCTSITVAAPNITCTTTGGSLSPGTITFLIGCADNNQNTTTCTTQSPRFINPTKSATAGTADIWQVGIKTQTTGIDQDLGTARIGTDDSVQVQASVDSSFTFTIGGVNNAAAINTGNTTGCTNSELSSSGFNASATSINLGSVPISSGVAPNISAQLISITSNGTGGYILTATSSGKLVDPSNGYSFPDDSSAPYSAFPAATPHFGIHACGLDVNTTNWGTVSTTTTRGGTALYGWPTQTTAVTLATDSTGPILGGSNGNGLTSVEYAVAGDASVPSGSYSTAINYVATPTF